MPPSRYPVWPLAISPEDEGRLWLRWLVILRWVAVAAQTLTVTAMLRVLDGPWVVFACLGFAGLLAVANVQTRRTLLAPGAVTEGMLVTQLGLDVAVLTGLFFLTSGPSNPFTVLYVIHVAMGAVMLGPRAAMGLTAFVMICYAALHLGHVELHLDRHSLGEPVLRRVGDAVAFGITTISVTGFVMGVASTLRWRSQELLQARDRTARTDRLRSVGTLAAGAAHELNTPLGTIGLRVRRLGRRHADPETLRDLEVVTHQLDRCEAIVQQLLVGAGDPSAALIERRRLGVLVSETVSMWSKGSDAKIEVSDRSDGLEVELPTIAFTQGFVNLLENACEAQREIGCQDPIRVDVRREDGRGVVVVRDHGVGLPAESERVGDPFFTTKDTGTGLGVYVARAVADGSGGGLRYVPAPVRGTEAHWWFPEAQRRSA